MVKKTVVLGASPNPARYAHLAVKQLLKAGHPVVAIGLRPGEIDGLPIITGTPAVSNVHTLTLYLGPQRQVPVYDYILSLQPVRIIFNPGTENPELEKMANERGIETMEACTLVLLAAHSY